MVSVKNILLIGAGNRPMATDIFCPNEAIPHPVVIYAHGFNGFKDWANFDIIANQFVAQGFVFIKFNFSHNGTTPAEPIEFTDLDAYAENNYTKELDDLQVVIDWAVSAINPYAEYINPTKLSLIGHSRGGGIVILKASEEKGVKAIATWASIAECKTPWGGWDEKKMAEWKEKGVQYYPNSRTQQQMPLHYQLYQDYERNAERLDIVKAISGLSIPVLICHGTSDEAVPVAKAHQLKQAQPGAELFLVESDHVFGRKHPWTAAELPTVMQSVVDKTINFFKTASV